MTSGAANPPERLWPWRAVWFRPRATIDYVLANEPRRYALLLAALGMIAEIVTLAIDYLGFWRELLDWGLVGVVGIGGAVVGVVSLYVFSALLKWTSLPFGGRASASAVRAAVAWSWVPLVIGVPIAVAIGVALDLSGLLHPKQIVAAFSAAAGVLAIWALVCELLMYSRVQGFGVWRTIINFALATVAAALLIALFIRVFLFQPFNTPSGSMTPTLVEGDYFFVSKYAYGYSRFTFPFAPPLFSGRVFAAEPRRGDIAVFRLPKDTSVDYVKRIVGLPGDRIQMIKGVLQINGQPVLNERVEDFAAADGSHPRRYRETLPNGVSYMILDLTDNGFYDNTPAFTVPPGNYFVLGDNRDNSSDSRLSQFGYVPFENLIGRAEVIYFSISPASRNAPRAIRFERIGAPIR